MDRLDMRQISKEFGCIAALSGVGFSARAGEVHAMMGDRAAPLAVVTGGGTGIGRTFAELLTASGYAVTALGLDRDDDLPVEIAFHTVDITDTAASVAALPEGRPVAALVNCAGMLRHQQEWETQAFEQVMRVNLTAGFALSNALVGRLEAGGGIVNVASMWAIFGSPGAPAYTASKAAVAAVTRSQAVAWAGRGIRVNSIAPGWIETKISEKARTDVARAERINARIPMGRWAKPPKSPPSCASCCRRMPPIPVDGGYSVC